MNEFVVVVEEGKIYFIGVGEVPHHDDFVELRLVLLQNVYILCHLLVRIVLVFHLQVHVPVGVDIVQYCAYLGKGR